MWLYDFNLGGYLCKISCNQFDNLDERVNNNNEAYDSRFNKRSGPGAHPNVWTFCEVLQQEEFSFVQVRYESLVQGNFKSRGRNKIDMQNLLYCLNKLTKNVVR